MVNFLYERTPKIVFGVNNFVKLPELISNKASKIILVLGSSSFKKTNNYDLLINELNKRSVSIFEVSVTGEPTPRIIDESVEKYKKENIQLVVSIGGGSVIDAGKSISAMLKVEGSVKDYLEGIGNRVHPGIKVPFFAVPTIAGTGSEATKNAVLSEVGENGFKKSLRHDNFVPDLVLVDPMLMVNCPLNKTVYSSLDALTQLIESYLSCNASPITEALALNAVEKFKKGFESIIRDSKDIEGRENLAYAAMISGITIANDGIGIVHGIAGPMGGLYDIPHGVICGTLIGEALKMNISKLKEQDINSKALVKYGKLGKILSDSNTDNILYNCDALLKTIDSWIEKMNIPKLSDYGIDEKGIEKIAQLSSNRNNPVILNKEEINSLLLKRM